MCGKLPVHSCRLLVLLALMQLSSAGTLHAQSSLSAGGESDESPIAQATGGSEPTPDSESGLGQRQDGVAERFGRLEDLLLRSSELESAENPTRAALLQQAAQLGKQTQLADLLATAAGNLKNQQYTQAIEKQKASLESFKKLLELLQSENRGERVREQRDQVRRWIEETDRLLRLQGSLRGRTEGGQDAQQAAGDQQRLANKAGDIASELGADEQADSERAGQEQDAASEGEPASADSRDSKEQSSDAPDDSEGARSSEPSADDRSPTSSESEARESASDAEQSQSGQGESKEGEPGEPQQSEQQSGAESQSGSQSEADSNGSQSESEASESQQQGQSQQGQSQQGQSQQGQSQQGQSQQGQSQQGQSQQGQSQQGQSQQGQSQQGQSPSGEQQTPQSPTERARQQIEQAREKMEEAQAELEQAERDGAIEKQREAEERLRQAIEQLEEILRQLREEEIERSLASLETRLRRMLEMQNQVLDETQRLNEISTADKPSRQIEIRASNLALEEKKILAEGERAFLLLREEGSSAAFPEAIEQLNMDIANVAERLSQAEIGELTLLIEQEIVTSLEEMVEALVQVQKENKERRQQQQQGQPAGGMSGEQPLVNKLAEIRLIKTLQLRINKRTDALAKLLDDPADSVGQVQSEEVLGELKSLSERQSSIQNVTRDIVVGKGE